MGHVTHKIERECHVLFWRIAWHNVFIFLYLWLDLFMYVARLIYMCGMTHLQVWLGAFYVCDIFSVMELMGILVSLCDVLIRLLPSYAWWRHVTHVNGSCHTCESGMSYIWMSHVTHMNVSCHTFECIMSRVWMNHVTHMSTSCQRYK